MDLDQYLEIMNANYWAYLNPLDLSALLFFDFQQEQDFLCHYVLNFETHVPEMLADNLIIIYLLQHHLFCRSWK